MSARLLLRLGLLLLSAFTCCNALEDGRYRRLNSTLSTTKQPSQKLQGPYMPPKNDGRYYPSNEGKYYGRDDGKYRPSAAGQYKHNDGKYVHRDVPYRHKDASNAGKYSGSNKKYNVPTKSDNSGGAVAFQVLKDQMKVAMSSMSEKSLLKHLLSPMGADLKVGKNGSRILYLFDKMEKDGYHYSYETENGINADEEGHIVDLPTGRGLRATGFYEYTGDDGLLYRVDYVADDAGFMARGAHIPETPKHVIKLLAYLRQQGKL